MLANGRWPGQILSRHDRRMVCAPFKTRSLRFEWETANPARPLIAKNAMNGAQRACVSRLMSSSSRLLTGPPAPTRSLTCLYIECDDSSAEVWKIACRAVEE